MLETWLSVGYIVLLAILVAISYGEGGARSGHRCTRGGYPPLEILPGWRKQQ